MSAGQVDPARSAEASSSGHLRLTREGLIWFATALILGLAVWFKNLNLLVFLAYLMLALLVLNGLLAWQQGRRTTVRRLAIPPVHAGEEFVVRVLVSNVGSHPATVTVEERGDLAARWLVERLPARTEIECREKRTFHRRGRLGTTPPVVSSEFPLGLLRHERPGEGSSEVIVLPPIGEVDAQELRRWVVRQSGTEGRSRNVPRRDTTDPADVRGVRSYRPGDSMQWIHWKSSARRGELMVREFDAAPSPELLLVIEPWLPESPTQAQRNDLEAALSLAASIFRSWCLSLDTKATLVVAGTSFAVMSGPPTAAFARAGLVPLADIPGEPDVRLPEPAGFGAALRRSARLVVSSRRLSPFADFLTRSTGKPFVSLDPSMKPNWYVPPNQTRGQRLTVGRLGPQLAMWYGDGDVN